jgi:hypothetical protein
MEDPTGESLEDRARRCVEDNPNRKIQAIKQLRSMTPGLGLKEAKDAVDRVTNNSRATGAAATPLPGGGSVSFGYAHYVGGHSRLGRGRQGNFHVTATELGIGMTRPKVAVISLVNVASVEITGGEVAKRKVGATVAFGVLGGLAAKGTKNQTAVVVHTKDGETAYYTIDKQAPINVRAKLTPMLKSAGVPFSDEAKSAPVVAPPAPDLAQQLRDLAALRDDGILTADEFATQKARLLDGAP